MALLLAAGCGSESFSSSAGEDLRLVPRRSRGMEEMSSSEREDSFTGTGLTGAPPFSCAAPGVAVGRPWA